MENYFSPFFQNRTKADEILKMNPLASAVWFFVRTDSDGLYLIDFLKISEIEKCAKKQRTTLGNFLFFPSFWILSKEMTPYRF